MTPVLVSSCGSESSSSTTGGEGGASTNTDTTDTTTISTPSTEGKQALYIPPLVEDSSANTVYGLETVTLQSTSHAFYEGVASTGTVALKTATSDSTYLGPTFKVRRGDDATFNLTNNLSESVTNHWHGLHIPGSVDGTPSQTITAGNTWSPMLQIRQEASTNFYHSHLHGATGRHVHNGHAGMFIIEDDNSDALDLPKTYGADDLPVIVQDRDFSSQLLDTYPDAAPALFRGNTLVVNGRVDNYVNVENKHIRLRLLNGSNASVYRFEFSDNRSFYKIATEGGFLPNPVSITSLEMAPGERNEIVVDLSGDANASVVLNAVRDGDSFTVLELHAIETASAAHTITAATDLRFNSGSTLDWASAASSFGSAGEALRLQLRGGREPSIAYTAGTITPFTEGNRAFSHNQLNFSVIQNTDVILDLTGNNHPFHIHGCSFLVLSENGNEPAEADKGWKDVVLLGNGTTRILMRFNYLTTDPDQTNALAKTNASDVAYHHPYMFHCHFLEHEDAGMMGIFSVVEA